MISRIVIHIGSHKTGTSSLQQHLHHNADDLLAHGIFYPELEGTPYIQQHSTLALNLRAADKQPALDALRAVRERAESREATTLLLSGEDFFVATAEEVALLKDGLGAPAECELRILLYLRNTWDYVRSQVNQHLRFANYAFTESEFLRNLAGYRPDDVIRRWEAVFGEESVRVFSYDEHRKDLLVHFADAAGIPRLDRYPPLSAEGLNPSIDYLCALLMNQLLFHRHWDLRAVVYSQLAGGTVPADILYPAEATVIERILRRARIRMTHPKSRAIANGLTPSIPVSQDWETTSIQRLRVTLEVIQSVLDRVAAFAAGTEESAAATPS